jgi:hypothetical protein
MKKTIITLFVWTLSLTHSIAQDHFVKPNYINANLSEEKQEYLTLSLDSLFKQMKENRLDSQFISSNKASLTFSILSQVQSYEVNKDSLHKTKKDKQLINFYPIENDAFHLDFSFLNPSEKGYVVFYFLSLIANDEGEKFTFESPLDYRTRHWKSQKIGNITYHFRDTIQLDRARKFDQKNTAIANKFGLAPEPLDFYMIDHYQEYLNLIGLNYQVYNNGKYRTGYGVDTNTIFSIMNNEDFSHDIFHYYSGKIHERENRNWITEEGVAYLWGNAYYTDKNGEMIEMDQMVSTLKNHLKENPDTSLLRLFEDNPKIFNSLASEISVRSVLSAIIAKEVELQKGTEGIMELVNAGAGKELVKKYLAVTDKLIGINKENFNAKVGALLNDR